MALPKEEMEETEKEEIEKEELEKEKTVEAPSNAPIYTKRN